MRSQTRIGPSELLEGEARNLRDDIIDGGLECGAGPGDVVLKLVEPVPDGELGRDFGDRIAGRLRRERARSRDTRVHLDDDHSAVGGVDGKLDIGAARIDPDLRDDRPGRIAEPLILAVGERHGRRHGDRVPGVNAHGVEVLDGANDGEVVGVVPDDLELVFLPPDQALFDQALMNRTALERPTNRLVQFGFVIGHAAAGASHRQGGTQDDRVPDAIRYRVGLLDGPSDVGARAAEANLVHRGLEELPLFGLSDGVDVRADQLHAVLLEDAAIGECQREVQGGLSPKGGQKRIGLLAFDDRFESLRGQRLDVGPVRELRVGHDRRRVGVDQDDPVALFFERLGALSAGVIELAGLPNYDRPRPNQKDAFNVIAAGHRVSSTWTFARTYQSPQGPATGNRSAPNSLTEGADDLSSSAALRAQSNPTSHLGDDLQLHPQNSSARHAGKLTAPLDKQHRPVFDQLVDAQLLELHFVGQAVEVRVDDRKTSFVVMQQRKRRAGHRCILRHAEPMEGASRKRRLASTEPALEADDVASLEHSRERPRQGKGTDFTVELELQHARALSHDGARCTLARVGHL